MQISLARPVVFKTGMTMAQAEAALEKARASGAARFLAFRIEATPTVSRPSSMSMALGSDAAPGWCLVGNIRGLVEAAMKEPEQFVIDVE